MLNDRQLWGDSRPLFGGQLSPKKIRIADLCCKAGGAAKGLWLAFPNVEIVGWDIEYQPRYPYRFIQGDALDADLTDFDLIWASPPCQGYTTMNNRHGSITPTLINEFREKLVKTGKPYVIENVPGARRDMKTLRGYVRLCGSSFGLGTWRHRIFEVWPYIRGTKCQHAGSKNLPIYGKLDGRRLWTRTDGSELRACKTLDEGLDAMGIGWMEWDELREAIPPAFSEYIGRQLQLTAAFEG